MVAKGIAAAFEGIVRDRNRELSLETFVRRNGGRAVAAALENWLCAVAQRSARVCGSSPAHRSKQVAGTSLEGIGKRSPERAGTNSSGAEATRRSQAILNRQEDRDRAWRRASQGRRDAALSTCGHVCFNGHARPV